MHHTDPKTLKIHPAASAIPDLPPAQYAALKDSIDRSGILQPLLVDDREGNLVIDGRHRLKAALELGLEAVPVASISATDAALTACEAAVARRNLTASGRVLILFLAHPALQAGGVDRRKGNLKRGAASPRSDLIVSGESKEFATFAALADRYGVPKDYFSTLVEIRGKCRDEDDWETVRRMILEGEVSIPRVNAGIGSRRSTTGTKRADPDYGTKAPTTLTTLINTFKAWPKIKWIRNDRVDVHAQVLGQFREAVAIAPPEIRGQVAAAVLDWPAHERAELAKELHAAGKRSRAIGG